MTIDHDYHGLKNTALMLLNRLTSMGDEGRLFGSESKDYLNTKRDKVQEWKPLPDDVGENIKAQSEIRKYGESRRISQIYLEGDDAWAVGGRSTYWQPPISDDVYEDRSETK